MIITTRGIIPIQDVRVGDYVLTHRGRYMAVQHIYGYEVPDAVVVAGGGMRGITVGANHRFLARRNHNPQKTRELEAERWFGIYEPEKEVLRHYWASPTSFPELELPDLPEGCTNALGLLALAGSYVADGFTMFSGHGGEPVGIGFVDAAEDIEDIRRLATSLGYNPRDAKQQSSASSIRIHNKVLAAWMIKHFGHLANGKKVPAWLLGAPLAARSAFLDAYLAGDGSWDDNRERWVATSASRSLATGVRLLGQSIGWAGAMSWVDPKVTHIMGVELKNKPQRSYRVSLTDPLRSKVLIEDGRQWGKFTKVTPAGETVMVYDLVVDTDNSYVGDGIIHHGSAFLPDGTSV